MIVQTTFVGRNPFGGSRFEPLAPLPKQKGLTKPKAKTAPSQSDVRVNWMTVEFRKQCTEIYQYVYDHHGCTTLEIATAFGKSQYRIGEFLRRGIQDEALSRELKSEGYSRSYIYGKFGTFAQESDDLLIDRIYDFIKANPGTLREEIKGAFENSNTVGSVLCYMVNHRKTYYMVDSEGAHYFHIEQP
jgi:hypothetical protein